MRRGSSTVVTLIGDASGNLLGAVGTASNVVALRPEGDDEPIAAALRRAQYVQSPFAVLTLDPLAEVAATWRRAWTDGAGFNDFELAFGSALGATRREGVELPDFYVVVLSPTGDTPDEGSPEPHRHDFHLGFLHSERPSRVLPVVGSGDAPRDSARILRVLSHLPQGPWWPPVDDLLDAARRYFPGALAGRRV